MNKETNQPELANTNTNEDVETVCCGGVGPCKCRDKSYDLPVRVTTPLTPEQIATIQQQIKHDLSKVKIYAFYERRTIKVKKLHSDAKLPTQSHPSDAGYDLYAIDDGNMVCDETGQLLYVEYDTGIAVEPPEGYHLEVFPRSSISTTILALANHVAVVDNGYRGSFKFRFRVLRPVGVASGPVPARIGKTYRKGDRIGQVQIKKTIHMDFIEVEELSDTKRSTGGFGSTGT